MLQGVVKINDMLERATRLYLYIENFDKGIDLILSSFSVAKIDNACTGELVRNGNFETGYSLFFVNMVMLSMILSTRHLDICSKFTTKKIQVIGCIRTCTLT